MSIDARKNFAKATVSIGYNAAATSIALTAGHGARLPAAPFNATWWNSTDYPNPADDPSVEIVRVTNVSTDTLTITRAQESTAASAKNTAGKTYSFIAGPTKKTIDDIETDLAAKADAAATTSALSGKEPSISAGTTGQYWRGDKSWQTLNASAVGLGSVDNTSDANKPVSTAQATAIAAKQDLPTIVTESTTARTLALSDAFKWIRCTNGSAVTVTVAPQGSVAWAAATEILIEQAGAGQVTIAPGSGVTLRTSLTAKTYGQYAILGLKRVASDEWVLFGERATS